jgi:hypothetical protein
VSQIERQMSMKQGLYGCWFTIHVSSYKLPSQGQFNSIQAMSLSKSKRHRSFH